MLPKKNRADRRVIERVFSGPRSVVSPHLTFKFKVHESGGEPRVSFVVPKTVSKKATDRNSLRRQGYLALEKYFSQIPMGIEGIFIFNKQSKEFFGKSKTEVQNLTPLLEQEIQTILKKL